MPRPLPPDVEELLGDLRSPDPVVRDEHAFSTLGELMVGGGLDSQLPTVLERAAELMGEAAVQARTFGALALSLAIERDGTAQILDADDVRRAHESFTRWWESESDLRGYDPELGWLHALAHGADALGSLAAHRHTDQGAVRELLQLTVHRLRLPTTYFTVQGEDDRIAYALVRALTHRDLVDEDARQLVDALATAWRDRAVGPADAMRFNTTAVARSLWLHLRLGVRDNHHRTLSFTPLLVRAGVELESALRSQRYWFSQSA